MGAVQIEVTSVNPSRWLRRMASTWQGIFPTASLATNGDERSSPVISGSYVSRMDKALNEAAARGWTVVDWKRVFAFEP
jgi:hypothetical protein